MRLLTLIVSALLVTGCGLIPGGLPSGPSPIERENAAAQELDGAIESYLALEQNEPSTPAEWERLLAEAEARTQRMRDAYDDWSDSVDEVIDQGALPESESVSAVREWQQVVGEWITAMEQQLSLTKSCVREGIVDQGCVQQVFREHGQEWVELGRRVNEVRAKITTE